MALTALNPEKWERTAQAFRNVTLVAKGFCQTKIELIRKSGDKINFPYISDIRRQSYTAGTDVTFYENTATQDSLTIDQREVAAFRVDPAEQLQAEADYESMYAEQAVYQLNRGVDQNVLALATANAKSTLAGGTLTSATIFTFASNAKAQLKRNKAKNGKLFLVLDPERASLVEQSGYANGFSVADAIYKNGYAGSFNGFEVMVSDNLPTSNTLTVDTNPTNGDTMTVDGITWTFVTNGTASSAGDISIGGSAAATQAIIKDALNGTGTAGASTYIDVSQDNRDTLVNDAVACGSFSSNVATITAHNLISGTETFTAGTNVFGTESTQMIAGVKGAVALGLQMSPTLYDAKESRRPGVINYMAHQLYGTAVFERCKNDLVTITHNV